MTKGPTWNEIEDPKNDNLIEIRDCGGYKHKERRMGKTRMLLTCPFCHTDLWAYSWSLAGGGKRCQCGALAGGDGLFRHFADRSKK